MLPGRYDHQCRWPALCCDCLSEICINKLRVPACPRCCPGASAFAYRAVIGLPRVPSATAERVGGRQHHKWVLNWNLTAALHFMCVKARSKAESDRRGEGKKEIKDKKKKKREGGKDGSRHMAKGTNNNKSDHRLDCSSSHGLLLITDTRVDQ